MKLASYIADGKPAFGLVTDIGVIKSFECPVIHVPRS